MIVAGADLLKEMKVFPNDKVHDVFFVQGYAYLDGDDKIYKYGYVNGEWKILQEIGRPQKFGLGEVARCGDHDVATLIGADSARFLVFEDLPPKQDWLERIGVRKLFRKYSDPVLITGSYGACAFPLRSRMELGSANGLASFGANGPQLFSVPDQQVRIPGDNVNFSKDGCYVLIGAPATRLLAVQSVQCQ